MAVSEPLASIDSVTENIQDPMASLVFTVRQSTQFEVRSKI